MRKHSLWKVVIAAGIIVAFWPHKARADPDVEIRLGNPSTLSSNVDNDTTKISVKGSITFQPITTGPAYGSNICSFAYRSTGETNMDPSYVTRCHGSLTWELYDTATGGIPWKLNLNKSGLLIGGLVGDTYAYPQARLDVRARNVDGVGQNTARFVNLDDGTYIRCQSSSSNRDCCTIYDDQYGEPQAAHGRCGALFGRSHNEINYGRYSSGWIYGGTVYSW